ncbi:cyclase family protein [Clostridium sp. SM-530-WT-3G]|uniref:cyclase family protein n=1 Tax=Clostridium sp. SM-530-WT-3G TaxID=2725303 RepID=UPI00145ED45B|nr:cyclase family protein [Clostridium sp. SM-530-WT-3G]
MKFLDLTHKLCNGMPVYMDKEAPKLENTAEVKNDRYKMTHLSIFSHNGTHIDAPAHMIEDGATLGEYDIEKFIGTAVVIDCRDVVLKEEPEIDLKYIEDNKEKIDEADFIIFYTGYCEYWGSDKYKKNCPYLSIEVADYIALKKKKGIGVDLMSPDKMGSGKLSAHKILLKNDVLIIENLANLDKLNCDEFILSALPLKYENADGAQVRAVAQIK